MKIFQYAVILHPTEDERKTGGSSALIVPVTTELAPDQNGAVVKAGRAIPEKYLPCLDRIEIAVRPF